MATDGFGGKTDQVANIEVDEIARYETFSDDRPMMVVIVVVVATTTAAAAAAVGGSAEAKPRQRKRTGRRHCKWHLQCTVQSECADHGHAPSPLSVP